jgi:asparagine synthase (glutamine-hydrolysing)
MCGIAGIVGPGAADAAEDVARLVHAFARRGPDGGGLVVRAEAAFAHRRLAVHDRSARGLQPFVDETSGSLAVVNGEFYDAPELRGRLAAAGVRLCGGSDSEVLLPLFRSEGPAVFARLRGPFAAAVFDAPSRTLHLARDRFGKRPLFYARRDDGLWFASEPGPLALTLGLRPRSEVLVPFLRRGYLRPPETAFAGLHALPPGARLSFSLADGALRVERYWTPPFPVGEDPRSDAELAAATGRLLDAAVARRLDGERGVGVLLSGGTDSAAVLAAAVDAGRAPVAYTARFADPRCDESAAAAETARLLGVRHVVVDAADGAAARLRRFATGSGDLLADSSALALGAVCTRAAADDVPVLLTGDGGDELFLGYERQYAAAYGGVKLQAAALLGKLPGAARSARVAKAVAAAGLPPRLAYAELSALCTKATLKRFVAPDALLAEDPLFADYVTTPPADDVLGDLARLDVLEYLPHDLLVKADRASTDAGAELRAPLLDPELAEFALALPGRRRTDGREAKKPLRGRLRDRGLSAVASRKKKGFGVPLAEWLLRGPLAPLAREVLHDVRAPFRGVLRDGSAAPALAALAAGEPVAPFVYACLVAALHHDAFA